MWGSRTIHFRLFRSMDVPIGKITSLGSLTELLTGGGKEDALSMLGYHGVYILEHRITKSPVYVGQGQDVGKRLRRHIGAILCGEFCHWNDREKTSKAVGLAKNTSGDTTKYIYVPESRSHKPFCMKDAMEFVQNLDAWLIRCDHRILRVIEGCLLRALSKNYLLANGDLSMRCTKDGASYVREVARGTKGMPTWLRDLGCEPV